MSEHAPHNPDQKPSGPEADEGIFSRAIGGIMNFVRSGVGGVMAAGAAAGSGLMRFLKDRAGIPYEEHGPSESHGAHGVDSHGGSHEARSEHAGHDDHASHDTHGASGHGDGHGSEHSEASQNTAGSVEKKYNQWTLAANDNGYNIFNKDADGKKAFYEVAKGEKHGNPIVTVEPDRAFTVPNGVTCVDSRGVTVTPNEKIAGIICEDGPRFSLSSKDAPTFQVANDGIITVGDKKWHLATLFSKDKNRFINYDAYFAKKRSDKVRVLELADLPLYKEAA
ncbi:MAG TPA: hypothetical protein VI588_02620 [Candidatus Gracilibacteria bacterium]|nr:hypothetical protein [Candidatus Gracilibacteria bacterium]